jgi:outer membrane protein OmpA-like peptidoglycan-associated protein
MIAELLNWVCASRPGEAKPTPLLLLLAALLALAFAGCHSKNPDPTSASTTRGRTVEKPNVPASVQASTPAANVAIALPDANGASGKPPESRPITPISPAAATGDRAHDWALKYERTENGPDADLVVRTGDINNLGFGWPAGFDPFSGKSTPGHTYPWKPAEDEPVGTDRILFGSSVDPADELRDVVAYNRLGSDGYSGILGDCALAGLSCKARQESMPQGIMLAMGALPSKINSVLLQVFVDDFQARRFHSHFQVSLNGTRIPSFEEALNSLDQTGPIGKLVTLRLLPEYWPILRTDHVEVLIDDPTTRVRDGYAVDFVRILVNPRNFSYQVSLVVFVLDADTRKPIPDATVTAAFDSATADKSGKCAFKGLPAGLVVATATSPNYDQNSTPVDLPTGETGRAEILLHKHQENTAALERSIAQTGSATIYGIHFDTDSARLKADSLPALNAVLGLVQNHAASGWLIAGHTDNQGNDARNQPLSEQRAAAVVAWLKGHGANVSQLVPQGFGSSRPVADNATATGRAINRRVEVALAK